MLRVSERGKQFLILKCEKCGSILRYGEWLKPSDHPEIEMELLCFAPFIRFETKECKRCRKTGA